MRRPQDHCPNFRCEELMSSCIGCVNDEENFREEDTVFLGDVCVLLDALAMIQILHLQCTETHADRNTLRCAWWLSQHTDHKHPGQPHSEARGIAWNEPQLRYSGEWRHI